MTGGAGSHPVVVRPPVDGPAGAAFTTRMGGAGAGPYASLNLGGGQGDDPAVVRANRRAVCAALGLAPDRVAIGQQVHGAEVRVLERPHGPAPFCEALEGWPEGDGLLSEAPGLGLAVLGADCLPVLLWRRDTPRVAAVHAGWRGLAQGVLERAVAALGDPARTGAAIGPGIGPCCYEVGDEVRGVFGTRFGDGVLAGRAVDLAAAGRASLVAGGLAPSAVWTLDTCTSCDAERWFSHRRDHGVTGRQAGIVWAAPAG